jgi:low affinity Fe/Cu permease
MNWAILIPVGIVLLALLVFVIVRNNRDKDQFEEQLNNDYRKPKEDEGEMDTGADTKL